MIVIFNTRFSASSASAFREELATRNRFKDAQGRADVFQDVFLQKRDMVNPLAQTLSVCELREVIFELLQQAEGAAISQLLQLTLIELTKALPANDEALSEILKQSKAKNLQRVLHHFGVDEPEATTSMSDGAKKTSAPGVGLQPKRPGE